MYTVQLTAFSLSLQVFLLCQCLLLFFVFLFFCPSFFVKVQNVDSVNKQQLLTAVISVIIFHHQDKHFCFREIDHKSYSFDCQLLPALSYFLLLLQLFFFFLKVFVIYGILKLCQTFSDLFLCIVLFLWISNCLPTAVDSTMHKLLDGIFQLIPIATAKQFA